jgi:cytochrome c-type biogenesis protein CcmH
VTSFIVVVVAMTAAVLALLLLPLLAKGRVVPVGSSRDLSVAVLRDQLKELEEQVRAGQLDHEAFAKEKMELERRVIEDAAGDVATPAGSGQDRKRALAAGLGAAIPILAAAMYLWLGSPESFKPQVADHGSHALTPQQIQAMTARLAERLQSNPDDGEGWLMLGRSYTQLGRFPEAAAAMGRASTLLPPSANLLADLADVTAMAQGRKLSGAPEQIVSRALTIDPNHVKSLALLGSAAFERGDYAAAIVPWRRILTLVPPESRAAQSIAGSIADAERRLGGAPSPVTAATPSVGGGRQPAAAGTDPSVSGTINLAADLAGKLPADATLFVFARAVDGSRVPLAMARVNPIRLPHAFKLDDSMSMTPNAKLSQAKSVIIGARISRGGDALAKAGDMEGFSPPVEVGARSVAVTIDKVVK